MKSLPASKAGPQLIKLFESVTQSGLPIRLTSHNASAILVSAEAWEAIEQTLYQVSTPSPGFSRTGIGDTGHDQS